MKAYWGTSALVEAYNNPAVQKRLHDERGFTRTHSLAEMFSVLTGKLPFRLDADKTLEVLNKFASSLDFVDLTTQEVLLALQECRQRGVRGGRVHDFLHAVAAKKSKADAILTLDKNDFINLVDSLQIEQL